MSSLRLQYQMPIYDLDRYLAVANACYTVRKIIKELETQGQQRHSILFCKMNYRVDYYRTVLDIRCCQVDRISSAIMSAIGGGQAVDNEMIGKCLNQIPARLGERFELDDEYIRESMADLWRVGYLPITNTEMIKDLLPNDPSVGVGDKTHIKRRVSVQRRFWTIDLELKQADPVDRALLPIIKMVIDGLISDMAYLYGLHCLDVEIVSGNSDSISLRYRCYHVPSGGYSMEDFRSKLEQRLTQESFSDEDVNNLVMMIEERIICFDPVSDYLETGVLIDRSKLIYHVMAKDNLNAALAKIGIKSIDDGDVN